LVFPEVKESSLVHFYLKKSGPSSSEFSGNQLYC
jgi:hypothetical protein